jgi:hypothetical protein
MTLFNKNVLKLINYLFEEIEENIYFSEEYVERK